MTKGKLLIICSIFYLLGFFTAHFIPKTPTDKVEKHNPANFEQREAPSSFVTASIDANPTTEAAKHREAISSLSEHVRKLEQELAQKDNTYREIANRLEKQTNAYKRAIEDGTIEDKRLPLSQFEAEQELPKPYSKVLEGPYGNLADDYFKFKNEDDDFDWGFNMATAIRDFVVMHKLSEQIKLDSVKCKTNSCEIRGLVSDADSWTIMLQEMHTQSWWKFKGTHSTSRTSKEFGQYFYVLATKEPQV